MQITRRPATDADRDFACAVHHAAYRDVVERQYGVWDDQAQDEFFGRSWSDGDFEIIACDGASCGYCSIYRRGEDLFVSELVIHPDFQGRGIGSHILREAISMARKDGVPVRLQTHIVNRAARLYRRLGFVETARTDTHLLMGRHE